MGGKYVDLALKKVISRYWSWGVSDVATLVIRIEFALYLRKGI